jgi:transposase-like protein
MLVQESCPKCGGYIARKYGLSKDRRQRWQCMYCGHVYATWVRTADVKESRQTAELRCAARGDK